VDFASTDQALPLLPSPVQRFFFYPYR